MGPDARVELTGDPLDEDRLTGAAGGEIGGLDVGDAARRSGAHVPTITSARRARAIRAAPRGMLASTPKRAAARAGDAGGQIDEEADGAPLAQLADDGGRGAGAAPIDGSHAARRAQPIVELGEAGIVALPGDRRRREARLREHGGEALPRAEVRGDEDDAATPRQRVAEDGGALGIECERAGGAFAGIEQGQGVGERVAGAEERSADMRATG